MMAHLFVPSLVHSFNVQMPTECLLRSRHVLGDGDTAVNKRNNKNITCTSYLRRRKQ